MQNQFTQIIKRRQDHRQENKNECQRQVIVGDTTQKGIFVFGLQHHFCRYFKLTFTFDDRKNLIVDKPFNKQLINFHLKHNESTRSSKGFVCQANSFKTFNQERMKLKKLKMIIRRFRIRLSLDRAKKKRKAKLELSKIQNFNSSDEREVS